MDWQALWSALALVLVIEGLLPFFNPSGYRRVMAAMSQMDERSLRTAGLVSMLIGVSVLFLVR